MTDYDEERRFFWQPDPAIQYMNLLRYNGEVIGAQGKRSIIRMEQTATANTQPQTRSRRGERVQA